MWEILNYVEEMTINYSLWFIFPNIVDSNLLGAHIEHNQMINNITDFLPQLRKLLITCEHGFRLTIYYPW